MNTTASLEQQLDDFSAVVRAQALRQLASQAVPVPVSDVAINMHMHSFFSYNARGYSPSRLAWEAKRAGFYAAGLCDFDVLDGLEEFLAAGRLLALRATVNLETRAYLREFGSVDINSPGEPGVSYVMGVGFARSLTDPKALAGVEVYRTGARERNESLIARVNARLTAVALDYAKDVLPLTPAGTATERHIIRAYANKARQRFPEAAALHAFWAGVLGGTAEDLAKLIKDTPAFEEKLRSKLAKRGGVGYEQPTPKTFPPMEDFIAWVLSCEAIPATTWLDGTSEGERDAVAMLECMQAKGAVAVNIIPDRNWNIKDEAARRVKVDKLREMVEAADRLHQPINIGTEMNRDGLPFVDDLTGPALKPYAATFLRGARVFVGHTLLARYAGFSYTGQAAAAEFSGKPAARNTFFESVGALPPLTEAISRRLEDMGAGKALSALRDSAKAGTWRV